MEKFKVKIFIECNAKETVEVVSVISRSNIKTLIISSILDSIEWNYITPDDILESNEDVLKLIQEVAIELGEEILESEKLWVELGYNKFIEQNMKEME